MENGCISNNPICFSFHYRRDPRFPLNHDSGQVILFHQPSAQLIHLTTPPLLGAMQHLSEVRLSYVFMGKTKNKKSFLEISRFPDFPYSHLGAPYGRFGSLFKVKLHRRIISSRWLSWPWNKGASWKVSCCGWLDRFNPCGDLTRFRGGFYSKCREIISQGSGGRQEINTKHVFFEKKTTETYCPPKKTEPEHDHLIVQKKLAFPFPWRVTNFRFWWGSKTYPT